MLVNCEILNWQLENISDVLLWTVMWEYILIFRVADSILNLRVAVQYLQHGKDILLPCWKKYVEIHPTWNHWKLEYKKCNVEALVEIQDDVIMRISVCGGPSLEFYCVVGISQFRIFKSTIGTLPFCILLIYAYKLRDGFTRDTRNSKNQTGILAPNGRRPEKKGEKIQLRRRPIVTGPGSF